uniref:hypothetical protein n=1 Tax=Shinella sp. TaxID=1870904 RepID=UPI003F71D7C9
INAEKAAEDTKTLFNRIGWLGALVAAVALVTLWGTFYFGLRNDINAVSGSMSEVSLGLTDLQSSNGSQIERLETLREKQEDLIRRFELNEQEIRELRRQMEINQTAPEAPSNSDFAPSPQDAE